MAGYKYKPTRRVSTGVKKYKPPPKKPRYKYKPTRRVSTGVKKARP